MNQSPDRSAWKILTPKGDLVVSSLSGLRKEMEMAEKERTLHIAVDLFGTHNIDSACIGFLTLFSKRILDQGGRFCLFGAPNEIADVLELVNFREQVKMYSTRREFEETEGICS